MSTDRFRTGTTFPHEATYIDATNVYDAYIEGMADDAIDDPVAAVADTLDLARETIGDVLEYVEQHAPAQTRDHLYARIHAERRQQKGDIDYETPLTYDERRAIQIASSQAYEKFDLVDEHLTE